MTKTRILGPLKNDHPLIFGSEAGRPCGVCNEPFWEGNRIVLVPVREPQLGVENVPAVVVHAKCALEGAKTSVGVIEHIKDGDASPFPIVTDKGQFKIEEAGYQE